MAEHSRDAAPAGAGAPARREAETSPAPVPVERPVLHSDGVVCA